MIRERTELYKSKNLKKKESNTGSTDNGNCLHNYYLYSLHLSILIIIPKYLIIYLRYRKEETNGLLRSVN